MAPVPKRAPKKVPLVPVPQPGPWGGPWNTGSTPLRTAKTIKAGTTSNTGGIFTQPPPGRVAIVLSEQTGHWLDVTQISVAASGHLILDLPSRPSGKSWAGDTVRLLPPTGAAAMMMPEPAVRIFWSVAFDMGQFLGIVPILTADSSTIDDDGDASDAAESTQTTQEPEPTIDEAWSAFIERYR